MMRHALNFLLPLALLAATACGNDPEDGNSEQSLQERAAVAERNLLRIRDAALRYYAENGRAPQSTSDLDDYGAGPAGMDESDDYADIAYNFLGLRFDEDGVLTRGWFIATPRAGRDALQVRINGVTETVEYLPAGEKWTASPEDDGYRPPSPVVE